MRKTGKTLVLVAMAAVAAGMTSPALAATARHEPVSRSAVAFMPGSGRSVVDWNRELITILGTPGAQPATVHPTRSFALLQAAEYDAVTSVTPFVLGGGRQFRPAPPPPITSAAYARALNQVKSLGQDSSTTRTADETTLAKFWGAAPIWNVWNEIAQKLAVTRHATLEQTVTVFANLDLALADATIALYDAKYPYLVWRPVTAIQLGNTIGNPGIFGDPNWN